MDPVSRASSVHVINNVSSAVEVREKKGLIAVVGQHTLSGVGNSLHAARAICFRIGRTVDLYLDVYSAKGEGTLEAHGAP